MKAVKQYHVQQQGQSDCGVACLKSVLRYFGGNASLERLREQSGTNVVGTTMLGLLQAGNTLGLETEGFEADIQSLTDCKDVCILHVVKDERLNHFIVYYGYDTEKQKFLIGDPANPYPEFLSVEALDKIWQSKSLLLFKCTEKFVTKNTIGDTRRWLIDFFKPDLNVLGIALFLGILIAVLGLSTAIFSQRLIDNILPKKDLFRLYTGVGLLCFLLLVRSFLTYLRQSFLLKQSKDFNIRLIDYFYGALLHLPKSFFDNRKTGELIARMNDTGRIQQTVSVLAGNVIIDILMVVISSVVVFYYDWRLGLINLLWLPVFGFIVWKFHNKIVTSQRAVMAAYAANESNYVDTIQGAGEIKLSNKQDYFQNLTKMVYGFFQEKIYGLGQTGLKFSVINEIASTIFLTGIITFSSVLVLKGNFTIGSVMAVLQMTGALMTSAGQLALVNIRLQEAKIAFERMREFTTIVPELNAEEDNKKISVESFQTLEVENLSFRFTGRKSLLENVSFQVRKGEMIAMLGESGCGKSTTLQILQKFYAAESGKIKVNGFDFEDISTENWRSMIGVMPQQIKLFSGTVIDNILMGEMVEDTTHLENFFNAYGFDKYFEKFPNGYGTLLGESGVNISGGQTQLIGLARALWKNPQVLLLDEPTAALDRDTEKFVIRLLEKIKPQTAVLILTHRISIAKNADRIYILKNGMIEESGNHNRLMLSDNLYARSWEDLIAV